jgi:hypothetical protein
MIRPATERSRRRTLFAYSSGSWRRTVSPNPTKRQTFYGAVAIPGTAHYWAVGNRGGGAATFAARH